MKAQERTTTRVCSICEIEKSVDEFYVRSGKVQKYCLECKRAKSRSHYNSNKDAYKSRAKVWAEDNREKRRVIVNEYDSRNRKKIREYHAERADTVNVNRRKEYAKSPDTKRLKSNEWYHENKHRPEVRATRAEQVAVRQRSLKQATPVWADKEAIKAIYREAQLLNDRTGVLHNVDHVVPIQSELVCGLHTQANLRVITAFKNQSKGNKLVEDIVSSTL